MDALGRDAERRDDVPTRALGHRDERVGALGRVRDHVGVKRASFPGAVLRQDQRNDVVDRHDGGDGPHERRREVRAVEQVHLLAPIERQFVPLPDRDRLVEKFSLVPLLALMPEGSL